jgi:hypothetical protein
MRIENLHWDANRIWILEGKTEKARRFVALSERNPCFGTLVLLLDGKGESGVLSFLG